jgi:hypothetical protein
VDEGAAVSRRNPQCIVSARSEESAVVSTAPDMSKLDGLQSYVCSIHATVSTTDAVSDLRILQEARRQAPTTPSGNVS